MPMNLVIQKKRKELGLTQEQIADYLGVSTPAVSKWEKGITSPDIALLPPLARLLKVDLNTLFCFHEDLTRQEIGQFCQELTIAAQNDLTATFHLAEGKLREFPHSEELMLSITIHLDALLLQSQLPDIEKSEMDEKIASWYSRLTQSADSKIQNSANYMMVNRYIRQGKLELAQNVLDTIEDPKKLTAPLPDKMLLQVSIYQKQNKPDLAALELERDLFFTLNRVQLLMAKLIDVELEDGKKEIAEKLAELAVNMTELLDLWKYSGYVGPFQIATAEKDADRVIELLEHMLDVLVSPQDFSSSPLFHRMAPEIPFTNSGHLLNMLVKELKQATDCDYLRDHPRFASLVEKYL